MRVVSRGYWIEEATGATTSTVFINNSCDSLGLQVTGTFSSATVKVQGTVDVDSSDWVDIIAIDLSDMSTETSGITAKGIYQIPIESLCKVRVNVTAVSGGNISVYAQVADTSNT